MPRHSETALASIKQAVDIAALIGDYLPLHRAGSKLKALCPFHDDHNPSMEVNADRQSYKCWSCGAGGDIFDFVQKYERVEFPEALRMLAERAGVALETSPDRTTPSGPSKTELLAATAWAQRQFAAALAQSAEARDYAEGRGISAESVARFGLGYAPDARDWLGLRARRDGHSIALLERAGLIARSPETPALTRDRFRGRLIFPINDTRGRPIAFGGRILPSAEKSLAEAGHRVAKYLNSPETALFQKRRNLYAADLARDESRKAGWVAVVEGYTDVIAAHQVGLSNVVGTLGTALGDDHVVALRRLADRIVLVFDGDEAGQKAADRSLELFLGHEIDVRVLTLPDGLDPCDFLLKEGAAPFRAMVDAAADPLEFAIRRASERFDFDSIDGARQAAESVLAVLARVPRASRAGLDVKVAKALDALSQRLRLPVSDLARLLKQHQTPRVARVSAGGGEPATGAEVSAYVPIRAADLDPLGRELVRIALNEAAAVPVLITRVTAASLRDAPLRAILSACYDLHAEGVPPTFDRVALRLDDPATRSLAAELLLPIERASLTDRARPAPWSDQLAGVLGQFARREWEGRCRDLLGAIAELKADPEATPEEIKSLDLEYCRVVTQPPQPDARKTSA